MATRRQLVNVKCILINPHIFHLKHFNANGHAPTQAASLKWGEGGILNVIIWHKLRV